MTTYSLYKYECGNLKIFGNLTKRAKYETVEVTHSWYDNEKRSTIV